MHIKPVGPHEGTMFICCLDGLHKWCRIVNTFLVYPIFQPNLFVRLFFSFFCFWNVILSGWCSIHVLLHRRGGHISGGMVDSIPSSLSTSYTNKSIKDWVKKSTGAYILVLSWQAVGIESFPLILSPCLSCQKQPQSHPQPSASQQWLK